MTAEVPHAGQRLTYEEWLALPETNLRLELVDGEVEVNSPTSRHQVVSMVLGSMLMQHLPRGYVVIPALDWLLRAGDHPLVRQPDLVVVPAGPDVAQLTEPPLLAVEILSPSTARTDLIRKRNEYARAGLSHYLIADPDEPALAYYALTDGMLREVRPMSSEPLDLPEPFSCRIDPTDLVPSSDLGDV